jgi:chromosomal replication initiation ATPase DnaA
MNNISELARAFGVDHASVCNSLKAASNLIATDPTFAARIANLRSALTTKTTSL